MSGVIEHDEVTVVGDDERRLAVGDPSARFSVKQYQAIYNQITGRFEQIKKRYSNNLMIEMSEIEQLNHKIMQLCDVHKIIATNQTVAVFHEKERKEQFSSFDRFKLYNSNCTSPTLSIALKYNFSIIPGDLEKPQEYTIYVRLVSRIASIKNMQENGPPFFSGTVLPSLLSQSTVELKIDYVDYVIARGFFEAVDEWIDGCKAVSDPPFLRRLQKRSALIPDVAQVLTALLMIVLTVNEVESLFSSQANSATIARSFVIYAGWSFIFIKLMELVGSMIEQAVDSYPVISYLKINRGDEKIIDKFKNNRKKVVVKFISACILTLILGFISSNLAEMF